MREHVSGNERPDLYRAPVRASYFTVPALVGTAVHHYTGKHRFIPARPMKVALGPIFVLIMIRAGVNAGTVHNLIGI